MTSSKSILVPINLPSDIDDRPIDPTLLQLLEAQRLELERLQDALFDEMLDDQPIEQFVAADFPLVCRVLDWIGTKRLATGRRFLEWGSGTGTITAMAAWMGWQAVGIEANLNLHQHARKTLETFGRGGDVHQGNFLPAGTDESKLDTHVDRNDWYATGSAPTLGHPVGSAYHEIGLKLADFDVIYSYPWPGESPVHQKVFCDHAGPEAIQVMFCGPNQVEVHQKGRRT